MAVRARVQHVYNHKSGLAEHGIVNTFYFHHDLMSSNDFGEDEATELADAVVDFYEESYNSELPVKDFIAEATMLATRHTVKVYDLADPEPRAPVVTINTNGGEVNNVLAPFPSEVAVCLSYRGALVSGTLAARRRGRIYIGPVAVNATDQDAATGFSRPVLAMRETLVASAQGLKDNSATSGWVWCVRSGGGGATPELVPDVFTPIQYAWVDDAWDIQRRRGATPLVRTSQDLGAVTLPFTQN